MHFTLVDAGGLLLSVVACGALIALPGIALARLFRITRQPEGSPDPLTGVVTGMAVLPLIDSMVTRFAGLDAALAVTLALAGAACLDPATRRLPRPSRMALALCGAWVCVVLAEWVDIDVAGRLFQPLTSTDTVKHAATAQAVLDSGAPPRDAFYLRPEHASYYYFFYTLAALVVRSCGGLADAKAAVGGLVFWTGVATFGLVRLAIARSGLEAPALGRRLPLLVVAVLAMGGVDVVAVALIAWRTGYWYPDPAQWNEQATGWLESLFWVPHHVTGLIAGALGLAALAGCAPAVGGIEPSGATRGRAILLAALCFAAALGLSVWVTLALVTTAALWAMILVVEKRWRLVASVALAGVLSLVLALPQLVDLHAGRAGPAELPITLTIRLFTPIEAILPDQPWNALARLLLLPVNYLIAFGALGVGAILFWRGPRPAAFARSEFARLLTISALVGLVLGAFLRSTLFNNDLGWRVTLFPILAATVWTVAVLDRLPRSAAPGGFGGLGGAVRRLGMSLPLPLAGVMLLGYATTGYLLFSFRAYQLLPLKPALRHLATEGETERGLRVAYAWSNDHLPAGAVLQHDPGRRRAFAFGLYSRNRVAVSDKFGSLFGAEPVAVDTRMRTLAPIFRGVLSTATVRAAALAAGIDDLVVTAEDPIWSQPASFAWTVPPVYASDRVRIIAVAALGERHASR